MWSVLCVLSLHPIAAELLRHRAITHIDTGSEASFPITVPRTMVLSLVNNAPWGYTVDHVDVAQGTWVVPPRKFIPAARTKPEPGNWAVQIKASSSGKISAIIGYNATGGGPGELNRNFAVQLSSGGNTFGIFFSHSHATDPVNDFPVFLGNNSVFTSLHALYINARRPLSLSCRAAAAQRCFGGSRMECNNCVAGNQTQLADAGCDAKAQMTDLVSVTCVAPPSDACRAAVYKVCPRVSKQDWNACGNCLDAHHASFEDACQDTSKAPILYACCVDQI